MLTIITFLAGLALMGVALLGSLSFAIAFPIFAIGFALFLIGA